MANTLSNFGQPEQHPCRDERAGRPGVRKKAKTREAIQDFGRLWAVPGFAEQFAANLADPQEGRSPGDPHELVLREHHDLLVAALRRAQRRGELTHDGSLDDLADALVGFYLGRRLERGDLERWASAAISTIIGD